MLTYSYGQYETCDSITVKKNFCFDSFSLGKGFALGYEHNMDCKWLFKSNQGTFVVNVELFETEACCDSMIIYDGPTIEYPIITKLSGSVSNSIYKSSNNEILFHFKSDLNVSGNGFSIMLECDSTPIVACNGTDTLNNCSGVISDGSNNYQYASNLDCGWSIQPNCSQQTQLTFDYVELFNFRGDTLYVYDGSDDSFPLLHKFDWQHLPQYPILASGSDLYINFQTDEATYGNGWQAHYESAPVSVEGIEKGSLKLSPNPSDGIIHLDLPVKYSMKNEILISNYLGKIVFETTSVGTSLTIDLSYLESGIYYLQVGNIIKALVLK